jgi:hypothetical protein
MLVSGTYGQAGAVYAFEMDDNTRVTQYGSHINSSSSYFVTDQPNGHQYTYGNSSQSRLIPHGKSQPLRWLLAEQKDVSRRNNVKYTYTNGAAGEKLLSNIRYTGNYNSFGDRGVYFHYENKIRPSVAYLAGGKTQATKRLKQITTKYGNDTVREYHLNYTTSHTTQRDILKNVELCGYTYNGSQPSTRKCAQKTQISTHMPSTQWAAPNTTAILGLPTIGKQDKVIQKDINGDGVSDVILLKKVSVAPQTLCANVDSDPDFDYDGCRGHFGV